jgi:hypothetical protein
MGRVFGPNACNPRLPSGPSINNKDGLLYKIKEAALGAPIRYPPVPESIQAVLGVLYRYRFDFNPDNPAQSTLRLVEIASPNVPPHVEARFISGSSLS